jgi:GNAT superfamily N-acetyltransferase
VRNVEIREFREGDEPGIRDVIKGVFDEYGFTWEEGGYNNDTAEVRNYYHATGGGFWVLTEGERIIGTVGIKGRTPAKCELYRLYLPKDQRGRGFGKLLYEFAQKAAREAGYVEMEIWSDKKLATAHQMYARSGAKPIGERICDDPDNSEEFGFLLAL